MDHFRHFLLEFDALLKKHTERLYWLAALLIWFYLGGFHEHHKNNETKTIEMITRTSKAHKGPVEISI